MKSNLRSPTILAKPDSVWDGSQLLDREGRTIWIVDAHRDQKRFIVRADELLTAHGAANAKDARQKRVSKCDRSQKKFRRLGRARAKTAGCNMSDQVEYKIVERDGAFIVSGPLRGWTS